MSKISVMKQIEFSLVKRHYGLFGEDKGKEQVVSSIEAADKAAKEDECCFGYYVNQREYVVVDGKRFYDKESKRVKNVVFGKLLTRDQVKAMDYNGKEVILERMTEEKASQVFHTRTNRWIPVGNLGKDAQIIEC